METESEYIAHHAVRSGVYLEFKENPGFDLVRVQFNNLDLVIFGNIIYKP